ncbi:MAG: anaerobic ribonucleoside-triphosphate reductase activating protein [Methanomassiliicoccaceae archaeon]|nr:anaerobic ribonucleoside-triphosphate reductase activating protein [Methanomassiliicoccaceae archaeon]
MRIAGFVKTTLQDWEGKNACMILLGGCNFRCPYCNRPDLAEGTGEDLDVSAVLRYIKENRDFLEAVVISGGEPTINADLYKLIADIRKLKVKIKLDTNGYAPDILDDLVGAKLVDKVCINIMAPLDAVSYSKAAGVEVDVELIRRSLRILDESGIAYEIRTVAVPGVITHDSFVKLLGDVDGSKSMIIQQFDPRVTLDPKMNIKPYPTPALVRMAETAKGFVERVRVRGL